MDAIIDTNVLVDIVSWHDAIEAAERDTAYQEYRFRRAGEALRLVILLNERRAETICHLHEIMDVLGKTAGPHKMDITTAYTTAFINFVMPKLLPQWRNQTQTAEEVTKLRSNKADRMLVALAKAEGCPPISHEGWGPDGFDHAKLIRTEAAKHGVPLFTAGEYVANQVTESTINRFLGAFNRLGPEFFARDAKYRGARNGMLLFYRAVLTGTNDPNKHEVAFRLLKPRA